MSRLGPGGNSLVMSTGVIGQALQMDKITKGIKDLSSAPPSSTSNNHGSFLSDSHDSWLAAARGIMTTDTFPKLASREIQCGNNVSLSDQSPQCNHVYRMAGFSKGAGMIHPNMATMLSCTSWREGKGREGMRWDGMGWDIKE